MDKTILVFGASLVWGAWDREGGWVQRLKRFIDEKNLSQKEYCFVYNLGISGQSTREIISRMESETRQRIKEGRGVIIILSVGVNDSYYFNEKKSHNVPHEEFGENLAKLSGIASKFTSKVMFLGPTPVDERVDPVPWRPEISYKLEYIKRYNEVVKEFCKHNNLHFIEILSEFMKSDYKKLLEDGGHPNSEGHKLIFETVKNYLIKNDVI